MNRTAQLTAIALALLATATTATAPAKPPNDPATSSIVTVNSCTANPYTYACWQGPRRPDGGPAYMIHFGISPL
jgi:hypothetical protein